MDYFIWQLYQRFRQWCVRTALLGFATLLIVGIALPFTQTVYGAAYGEGTYGQGLYGEGQSTPSPELSLSPAGAPTCNAPVPGSAPWLYAATSHHASSIELYFTQANDPVDHYVVEYGLQSGHYIFGATNVGGRGTRSVVIQALMPGTTYFFRIRAGNGCAVGQWSNELSAQTRGMFPWGNGQTSIPAFETFPDRQKDAGDDFPSTTYRLVLRVVDRDNQPIQGATVILDDASMAVQTDADGRATFDQLNEGQQRFTITHDGISSNHVVYLQGDNAEIEMTVQVAGSNTPAIHSRNVVWLLGGAGILIVSFLVGRRLISSRS